MILNSDMRPEDLLKTLGKADELVMKHITWSPDGMVAPHKLADGTNEMTVTLTFGKYLGNLYGYLHGGITAFLVDMLTSLHLIAATGRAGHVSASLHISYLRPVPIGRQVVVRTTILSTGKRAAFLACRFTEADGDRSLLAKGEHLKLFVNSQKAEDALAAGVSAGVVASKL